MEYRLADLTRHVVPVAAAAGIGLAAGAFFFGTLWLTVRRLTASAHPHLLLFASFVVRAAVALGAFYLLTEEGPVMVLVAVAAFVVSRSVLVRYLAPQEKDPAAR